GSARGSGRAPRRAPGRRDARAGGAVWDACRFVVRGLVRPAAAAPGPSVTHRLRVEADGVLLSDLDRPVAGVAVSAPGDGYAEVAVRLPGGGEPVRATAAAVTISGPDFRYHADGRVAGPVRTRTWTLHPAAWSLTLPAHPGGDAPAW
ncbi:diacylglycerol kinase, partial [Streptomyces bomunensis]|nr:diacylglycerol kinase [Streptomyces montanisoli]